MANENHADFTPTIPDSKITPEKAPYVPVGSFKFWAQKVLPSAYDDSLSYYEVLTKLVWHINKMIEDMDNFNQTIDSTLSAYNSTRVYVNTIKDTMVATYNKLQDYVNHYFDNLDVQEEINAKLDTMADNGELTNLLAPVIPDLVTAWLNQHVTPTSPIIDNTLSISGAGADAKVTGDRLSETDTVIDNIYDICTFEALEPTVYTKQFVKKDGTLASGNSYNCFEYTVEPNSIYNVAGYYGWDAAACVWFDGDGNVIKTSIYNRDRYIEEGTWFDTKLISPTNANKVRINGLVSESGTGKSGVQEIHFNKATKAFALYDINPTWVYDKMWESGSAREVDLAGSKYCKISVNPGDIYIIESTSNYYGRAWAFYDASGIMINRQETEAAYISDVVAVPNNAVTMAINAFSSDGTRNIRNYCRIQKLAINNNYRTYSRYRELKWVALGDSITDIKTLKTSNNLYYMPNYVNFVSDELGITAINKGIGGTGYLSNNSGASTTFAERALTLDSDTDITTVFGTLNDIYLDNLQIGTKDDEVGANTVCGQVKQTIENLYTVNPEMLIVIVTPCPFPRGNGINTSDSLYQVTQNYVSALIDVARMYSLPVLDLFHESGLRPWNADFKATHYLNGDGQHLNSDAHRRYIAPKFADIIRKCCDID